MVVEIGHWERRFIGGMICRIYFIWDWWGGRPNQNSGAATAGIHADDPTTCGWVMMRKTEEDARDMPLQTSAAGS